MEVSEKSASMLIFTLILELASRESTSKVSENFGFGNEVTTRIMCWLAMNRLLKNAFKNGILYLKGGDLTQELKQYTNVKAFLLSDYFEEDFFETKKVVHLVKG